MNIRSVCVTILTIMLIVSVFSGCADKNKSQSTDVAAKEEATRKEEQLQETFPPDAGYFQEVGANELGRIMILEYHVIGEQDGRWARSYTSFRKDLEKLYQNDYVLVSLRDMIQGTMDIPAGKSPVVLTFDDGTPGQFRYTKDESGEWMIDPESGVGVLTKFAEEHPDFGLEATFFINYYTPFGQGAELSRKKIAEVIEMGMDIGNHSANHLRMNTLSKEETEKELALIVKLVNDIVPGYQVDTFALPFGIGTKDPQWGIRGQYQGTEYHHIGVLLVGSTPAPSPYNKRFNPYALERVQVFEDNLDKWIDFLNNNPLQRYVSDGYPEIISYPKENEEFIDRSHFEEIIISY